ncbi:hypothetical protein [Sphingosinicella sp. CPCC 101087]|uniref:hypothetical protein n=1 Tax=Sphingosinicella sp. CPCC 101087 TaxID=2497754 RepID=UPI001FB1026A|nr:hypothetical protein [Sphingosinicella sp. CPCC 101087]
MLILLLAASAMSAPERAEAPADAFFAHLSALCGRAFEGRIVSPPVASDREFAGKRLTMHVRDCGENEIRIPFRVGEDASRTWVISRRAHPGEASAVLGLSHDHRHGDGSEDRLSRYGGASVAPGTESRQEFPADAFSRDLFARENLPASIENVWAVEVHPARKFAYELRRPGRFFRVEFDLSRPVEPGSAG